MTTLAVNCATHATDVPALDDSNGFEISSACAEKIELPTAPEYGSVGFHGLALFAILIVTAFLGGACADFISNARQTGETIMLRNALARAKKHVVKISLWKTVWNRDGLEMPGWLIAAGGRLVAFVPNMDHESVKVAARIARDPRRAGRRSDNHCVIFDLRGTSIADESNAGFLNQIMWPLDLQGRPLTGEKFPASEFMRDPSRGCIGVFAYTKSGLEHRLKEGPRSQEIEIPFVGHGYAGDGWAKVKPGKEMQHEGMTFGRDADSFEQLPTAPSAA